MKKKDTFNVYFLRYIKNKKIKRQIFLGENLRKLRINLWKIIKATSN